MKGLKTIGNFLLAIAGCVFIVLVLTGKLNDPAERLFHMFSNDPENSWVKAGNQVSEKGQGENEEQQTSKQKFYVGDTISYVNGLRATIIDAGTEYDMDLNEIYVYVELDINNQSDSEILPSMYYSGFYGDDYSLEQIIGFEDNLLGLGTIAAGRKKQGKFYAACPGYDGISNIEMEFGDAVIVVKDDSMVKNESDTPENDIQMLTYGTYVFEDTEWGNIGTAEIGFASEDGVDTIHIEYKREDGNTIIEFNGIFEPQREDGSYIAHCTDYEGEIWCTFSEDGLNIEVADIEFNDGWDLAGWYKLESKLNLDEVG